MKNFVRITFILLLLLSFSSCTQYRFFPVIPPADDSTPYDVSTPEAFEEMFNTTGKVRLMADLIVGSESDIFELPEEIVTYDIDLNGNELTINTYGSVELDDNKNLSITDGTLHISIHDPKYEADFESNAHANALVIKANARLELTNAAYDSDISGIYLQGSGSTLIADNTDIVAKGLYGVGTNAEDGDTNISIIIRNGSKIISEFRYGVGILINVPGTLMISDSYIESGAQTVIVRGGTATIERSILFARNENSDTEDFKTFNTSKWYSGNGVPFSSLVVGNRANGDYVYSTYCVVTDTDIMMQNKDSYNFVNEVYISSDNDERVDLYITEPYASGVKTGSFYWGKNTYLNGDKLPVNESGDPSSVQSEP